MPNYLCCCVYSLLNSDPNRPKYPATLSLRKEGNGICLFVVFFVIMLVCRYACIMHVYIQEWRHYELLAVLYMSMDMYSVCMYSVCVSVCVLFCFYCLFEPT